MLCSYGCGKKALYKLKNKKWCCSEKYQQCHMMRKKNSIAVKKNRQYEKDNNIIRKYSIKIECRYCNRKISNCAILRHEQHCCLNPINIRLCPICETSIKNKKSVTCSKKCSQVHFREKFDYIRKNRDMSWTNEEPSYVSICFQHHKKECIVCGEDLVVSAHHYDGNKNNNDPTNFVPLCPTHHLYVHSTVEYMYIIKECVDDYVFNFIQRYSKVA